VISVTLRCNPRNLILQVKIMDLESPALPWSKGKASD